MRDWKSTSGKICWEEGLRKSIKSLEETSGFKGIGGWGRVSKVQAKKDRKKH